MGASGTTDGLCAFLRFCGRWMASAHTISPGLWCTRASARRAATTMRVQPWVSTSTRYSTIAMSGPRHGCRLPETRICTLAPMSLRTCAGRMREPEEAGARRRGLRGAQAAALVQDLLARRRLRRVRRSGMQAGARRGLRRAAAAAAAAAELPPVPLPRRLRRRARPPGMRRRVASHRASGVGRAAGILALATGTLGLRGSRSRRRAGARSAGCPRQLGQARATMMTTLAGPRAFRPRTRPLLGSSQALGRRLPTAIGFALRRKRSIKRNVWLVHGGMARARSAAVCPRRAATCSARGTSASKGQRGGMGASTGQSRRPN